MDANIGQVADVLGYTVLPTRVLAGESLSVTVFWQPHAHTGQPYTAFVHLLDPAHGSLAQVGRYPGHCRYPTDRWPLEQPFVDTFTLQIRPDAAAAPNATLVLGLYDLQTLQRLPTTGANAGANGEAWVQLGSIEVMP